MKCKDPEIGTNLCEKQCDHDRMCMGESQSDEVTEEIKGQIRQVLMGYDKD